MIISIVGLPGSGKSEVINYLQKKFSWPKVYFGDVTFDEMKRLGLEINEANERKTREGLREKFGELHYAKESIKKIDDIKKDTNILVESLYSWGEYKLFKEKFRDNLIIMAVYASPRVRYARLKNRPVRPLTEQESQSRDYAQIENIDQAGPIAMADYTIINEKTMGELQKQIEGIIEIINSK